MKSNRLSQNFRFYAMCLEVMVTAAAMLMVVMVVAKATMVVFVVYAKKTSEQNLIQTENCCDNSV